ncbi:MAG: transposase [Planctomycetes bacterium]|nr:transposase [Planctomycetota bacterium]
MVLTPPQVTISRLMQYLKGKSSHWLLAEFLHLRKALWGRTFGHVGILVAVAAM